MSEIVLARIAAWEAAGLVDAATAERLRSAEAGLADDDALERSAATAPTGAASSFFGPPVSLVEAFSYLGAAFVLAAWTALIARLSGQATDATRDWLLVAGTAIPAAIFFAIGVTLHGRSPRLDRAAGVAFAVSVALIWLGVTLNFDIFSDSSLAAFAGAAAGLAAAAAYRWVHPSILTEIAVLATLTGLVQAGMLLLNGILSPVEPLPFGGEFNNPTLGEAVIASVVWLATAVVIGLLALAESRNPAPEAGRRASVARFWAGIVAVGGVASSLSQTAYDESGFGHRVVEPWVAAVIVLAISAVLLERAFRRESAAYVLAAAFGVVVALTDFNASYLAPASGIEVALLVEGLLLIAIALGADRIRRRVRDTPPEEPGGNVGPPRPNDERDTQPEPGAESPLS
jgi:hypothetical protein